MNKRQQNTRKQELVSWNYRDVLAGLKTGSGQTERYDGMAAYAKYLDRMTDEELATHWREQVNFHERAFFFNRLRASSHSIEDWTAARYWTVDEAVALLLGKDPDVVTFERLDRDQIDGPLRTRCFRPSSDQCEYDQRPVLHITHEYYDRMMRESRAYYTMREEIRRMADHLLVQYSKSL